ncbi:hypothetical protein [Pseudomonas cavernicola]|uniref:hypothetical protein n=1 Tax=Pseudomonas cavernicola TaxID=2320866 RepID=UPI0011C4073C|nr:hypothetical protein [Pseudomonas cavernicola]
MRRIILALTASIISINASAEISPTMSCTFESFIGISHAEPENSRKSPIHQGMRIVQGKTDSNTLKLDGAKRATNSNIWQAATPAGWETLESTYIGDFNEILSLSHELGANKRPLRGPYKASLTTTGVESTSIMLGNCLVE